MSAIVTIMAERPSKTRTKNSDSPPATPEKRDPADTAEVLRELGEHLRSHADYMDRLADAVEKMGSPKLNVLTGNFYWALEKIRIFWSIQVIQKLINSTKYRNPKLDMRVLGDLVTGIGELSESVAGRAIEE